MPKIKVIKYLCEARSGSRPTLERIESELDIGAAILSGIIKEINDDEIYKVETVQRGGHSINNKISKEVHIYKHIAKCADKWICGNIFSDHVKTKIYSNPKMPVKLDWRWSSPDLSFICVHNLLHTDKRVFDVVTFEVKHVKNQFDVLGVYEALAHTRASNYSILYFYYDPTIDIYGPDYGSILSEIKFECVRLGVGLVLSKYPCEIATWEYVIPVKRHEPDVRRVDSFIELAFEKAGKTWLKHPE